MTHTKVLSIVALLVLTGCATQGDPVAIPDDHPASPRASGSAYQPSPNVLASDPQAAHAALTGGGAHHGQANHGGHASQGGHASRRPAPAAFPVEVCVVSGEKLGSMGKPVTVQHQGRTIPLCCKGCVDEFKEDPAKFTAKYDALIAAKKKPADPRHDGHPH
jgi:hypothetical protein